MKRDKEPVRIREKKLKEGNKSLYLDIYIDGRRSYEFLKLYLVPETDKKSRIANRDTMHIAEVIKARRILEIQEGRFDIDGVRDLGLVDYFNRIISKKAGDGVVNMTVYHNTLHHLMMFSGEGTMLSDVDKVFCERFRNYLTHSKLKPSTVCEYLARFKIMLREAFKEGYMSSDLTSFVIMPKNQCAIKCYLTIDELNLLIGTEYDCCVKRLRDAFLFSCFTGLRWSDITGLRWSDVSDDMTKVVFRQKKTKGVLYLDIPVPARRYMGERNEDEVNVFDGLFKSARMSRYLQEWCGKAGVYKPVTFHSARHTFATMMLTLGADLYTVSSLLGHSSISTTQVYAKIVDEKKKAAVNLIDEKFR